MTPIRARGSQHGLTCLLMATAVLCAGCASFFNVPRKAHRSSSVVSYLYPGKADPLPPTSIPVLRLPLRVGIAFVPSGAHEASGNYGRGSDLTELQKSTLMRQVADAFKGRDYIHSIEVVPSSYLRAGGGFENLEQVRALMGVDVIALVAYDQVQFTNENFLALAYWTIVGAYIFEGNKNDTHTMMEAAVYDISSRHLLFRAPGASNVKASAAAVYLADNLRKDSAKGFDVATTDMITNLTAQLEQFRERIKQAPEEVRIERRPGYTGSGSFSGASAGLLALLLGFALWRRRS